MGDKCFYSHERDTALPSAPIRVRGERREFRGGRPMTAGLDHRPRFGSEDSIEAMAPAPSRGGRMRGGFARRT
jgi:hypothetical protein